MARHPELNSGLESPDISGMYNRSNLDQATLTTYSCDEVNLREMLAFSLERKALEHFRPDIACLRMRASCA